MAWEAKLKQRKKNKKKMKNLKYKYLENKEKKEKPVPRGLEEFSNMGFMKREAFEEIEIPEREILIISEGISLNEDEKAILRCIPNSPL